MSILTDIRKRIDVVETHAGMDVEAGLLLESMRRLGTDAVMDVLARASEIRHDAERLIAVGAAVLAERSTRDQGQSGAAAVHGHSSPVSLIQSISGGTRADAVRAVRIGEALREGGRPPLGTDAETELSAVEPGNPGDVSLPWHDPLRRAMLAGALTPAQHDAILRGLGNPPDGADLDPEAPAAVRDVWTLAATQLIAEAEGIEVEQLARRARQVRDALDPAGTEQRRARRFDGRTFRMWTDPDGGQHGRIDFEEEGGAFWQAVLASAFRPRRGGPRFVTDEERAAAEKLLADPRTNDQLAYDLITDIFRAGALATASDVFGARQPGVRMVVVKDATGHRDAFGRMRATGHFEDGGDAIAGSILDRAICDVGSVEVTMDACGNPLDVGREQRLFTPKQKLAFAVRDGGCMWPGCWMTASYCEAHHADHWSDGGRTDTKSGLLLCRFHHILLHNAGWVIRRDGTGQFVLHRPPGIPGRTHRAGIEVRDSLGLGPTTTQEPNRLARGVSGCGCGCGQALPTLSPQHASGTGGPIRAAVVRTGRLGRVAFGHPLN